MRTFVLRSVNRLGNVLSHRQRRFVLDTLGLGHLLDRVASSDLAELVLPNQIVLAYNPLLHSHLTRDGRLAYEPDVLDAIQSHLRVGDVFYDAGANIGVFSFLAATLVGESGAVLAFEPEENNVACFRRSLAAAALGNVTLYACGLGAADGEMVFDRRGGAFSGRLVGAPAEAQHRGISVPVRSIDSLVEGGAPAPSLIKIDVEGGEGAVLEGARRTLGRHRPAILCEMLSDNPDGVLRAFRALAEAGYTCHSLDRVRRLSEPLDTDGTYHVFATAAGVDAD